MGKVAIVGAGPSGCFVAQALLKAAPDLEVDVIDALPVPYGLVRYGVAADHQGTKAIARQFERVFERQGARFFGNLTLGRDLGLDDLAAAYDAVVLAAGLAGDRRLGVPGDDLPGVIGAGALTRALYDHPDAGALPALGHHPLIIGNGNVAIDLLRLLAKTPEELAGSDLGPEASAWLAAQPIESVTIVGRSPAAQAKFDPVMIKELGKLAGVTVQMDPLGAPGENKTLAALAALEGLATGPRVLRFRFGLTPAAIEGAGGVEAVHFEGAAGAERIAATSVLTAIGFAHEGPLARDALMAGADAAGRLAPGLYATGWFRRGPRGTIPDNRADAQALAARVLAELAPDPEKPGRAVLADRPGLVTFEGWQRIDAAETAAPPPERCRVKIKSRAGLLAAAGVTEGAK